MYQIHKEFHSPENEKVKIWRFMNFGKYVSMLKENALYFSRPDFLGDPFEGTYTKFEIDKFEKDSNLSEEKKKRLRHFYFKDADFWKKMNLVNCWHMNEFEPSNMWETYIKNNQGIAIQSTFEKLKKSFEENKITIYIGKVNYLDYDSEEITFGNAFRPLLHKRKNFEDEKELRVMAYDLEIMLDKPVMPEGLDVKTNLDTLIGSIIVAPKAKPWFKELVRSIGKKFGLDKPVYDSKLDEKPPGF